MSWGSWQYDLATWNAAERLVKLGYVCCLHWLVRTCVRMYNTCCFFWGLDWQDTIAEATDAVSFLCVRNDS